MAGAAFSPCAGASFGAWAAAAGAWPLAPCGSWDALGAPWSVAGAACCATGFVAPFTGVGACAGGAALACDGEGWPWLVGPGAAWDGAVLPCPAVCVDSASLDLVASLSVARAKALARIAFASNLGVAVGALAGASTANKLMTRHRNTKPFYHIALECAIRRQNGFFRSFSAWSWPMRARCIQAVWQTRKSRRHPGSAPA
ncbi:MAG: hypothetical protein RL318_1440 [Fibrobacterota bacterium]